MSNIDELQRIKNHIWFYEFPLPDGTTTQSYLSPEVARIHTTREKVLRRYLAASSFSRRTALDVSCHEGFFSLILGEYFQSVIGIDKNEDSLILAEKMRSFLRKENITFLHCPVEEASSGLKRDFVLCYGLIYHVENPLQILRKLGDLAEKALCIETQVLPFSVSFSMEDGHYMNQREVKGLFALCPDYPDSKEGGLTEYALVPTQDAMLHILRSLGFKTIVVYEPEAGDYEQFVRGSRIILFAER